MKYKINTKLIFAFIGGLLFNYLFWMEKLAFNLVLYSLFILIIAVFEQSIINQKKLLWVWASHLASCLFVVINQSTLTIVTWCISLFVLVAHLHYPQLRSIITSLIIALLQFITSPINLVKEITKIKIVNLSLMPLLKLIKYIVIPSFILFLFSVIYSIANPVFASYVAAIFKNINQWVSYIANFIFSDLNLAMIIHLAFGIVFSTGVFITFKNDLQKIESACTINLIRFRKAKRDPTISREIIMIFAGNLLDKKMALKTENTIATLSFTGLNMLLFLLNTIDISTLWIGDLGSQNFSQALHSSTNVLIISIVMAMMVILYFFHGNLNFYRKNKTMRVLAYIWMIQNIFLVLSVLLRDYHYISMQGLTYKRIGVIIFSLLCFIGLATVYIKVAKQKSLFYLLKINSIIYYLLLLLSCTLNWDVFIVHYNLKRSATATIDINYIMTFPDKILPIVIENKNILKKHLSASNWSYSYQDTKKAETLANSSTIEKSIIDPTSINKPANQTLNTAFDRELDHRIKRFEARQRKLSWLSWNYRDWQTQHYIEQYKARLLKD